MHGSDELCNFSLTSCNSKMKKLDKSLQQSLIDFNDLRTEFEKVCIDSENYKSQFLTQKEKCESQICSSGEILNKVIEAKNKIIQLIASSLTQLSETKNFAIIEDIFKVLCEENYTVALSKQSLEKPIKKEKTSPRANESVTNDISFNCSGNEIEDTPGRTSPILKCKKVKTKNHIMCNKSDNSSDFRDKKKCPETWPTPEKKAMKLQYPIPMREKRGKMRQMRLNYDRIKTSSVVDLTCSMDFSGGLRCPRTGSSSNLERLLIKKESSENDDTIMPSPTSGSSTFPLSKSRTKDSPVKYKKPLSLKIKKEKENQRKLDLLPIKRELKDKTCLEDSVNILNPVPERSLNNLKIGSPVKQIIDQDRTHCDNSISILPQCSPSKRPLVENNINKKNVPNEDIESSISLLRPEVVLRMSENDDVKRKMPEPSEPVFKEAAVRKKSEKRALPGWICEACKNFYGVLYEDNPLMLAKMIEECSKHRGRRNPVRPKTPPNFWNPRWEVPEDTEELNRLNNAI